MTFGWVAAGSVVLLAICLATVFLLPKPKREDDVPIEGLRGKYRDRLPPSDSYLKLRERDEHETNSV